jgi:hypothetical protein
MGTPSQPLVDLVTRSLLCGVWAVIRRELRPREAIAPRGRGPVQRSRGRVIADDGYEWRADPTQKASRCASSGPPRTRVR